MKLMKIIGYFTTAFCASMFIMACNIEQEIDAADKNGEAVMTDGMVDDVSDVIIDELADFKFHTFIANIPSPLQTFHTLKKAGVDFHVNLANPVENRGKYTASSSIALNYGIYMADLGYFTVYEQQQQSIRYFAASRELAQKLGFANILDKVASKRFETNTGNTDSAMVIIDDAFVAMEEYLATNEQLKTMGLISAGSWLESQHITVNMLLHSEKLADSPELANQVYEQKLHLVNLLKFLSEYKDEKEFANVIEGFNRILVVYNTLAGTDSVNTENLQQILDALEDMRRGLTG